MLTLAATDEPRIRALEQAEQGRSLLDCNRSSAEILSASGGEAGGQEEGTDTPEWFHIGTGQLPKGEPQV